MALSDQLDGQLTAFAIAVGNDMQIQIETTGDKSNLLTLDKSNLVSAVNELKIISDIYELDINDLSDDVLLLIEDVGDLSLLSTNQKGNLVSSINELFGAIQATDIDLAALLNRITNLESGLGDLSALNTTNKTSAVSAINEVIVLTEDNAVAIDDVEARVDEHEIDIQAIIDDIGGLENLTTATKLSLVLAINELVSNQGTLANLTTTNKTALVLAINEIDARAKKSSFWGGAWQSKTWLYNEMSRQGNWLGIVNNVDGTTDHLEPQNDGAEEDSIDPDVVFTEVSDISVVKMVHKFTFSQEGFSVLVDTKAVEHTNDTIARITLFNRTSGNVSVYNNVILGDDAWTLITAQQTAIAIGDELEVWFEIYNSASAGAIDGGWNSSIGTGEPIATEFQIDNVAIPTVIEISHTDLDTGDRSTELDGVVVGSIIHISETASPERSVEVEVSAIDITSTTSTKYAVSLINLGASNIRDNRICTISIDNPVTVPTKYYKVVDHYLGATNQPSFANITTELYFDGVQQASVTDGYGINFIFQKATFSADWDIMSDGTSSGIGTGEATESSMVYDAETDTYYAKPTADGQVQNIGQEMFFNGINDNGTDATELNPKVFLALKADVTYPKWETCSKPIASDVKNGAKFGINTTAALIIGDRKFKCTTYGRVSNVNTSAWAANTQLYIDPSIPGDLTDVEPSENIYPVAKVLVQHATEGVLDVLAIGRSRQDKDVNTFSQDDFYFTADVEAVTAPGSFRVIGFGEQGILPSAIGTVTVTDNSSGASSIEYLFPSGASAVTLTKGTYKAFLDAAVDDIGANEKFVIQAYHSDENGVAIDSGIASQPIGVLGVKPVFSYNSTTLDIQVANVVNSIELSGLLADDYSIPIGHRFRFTVVCSKVGTAGGSKVFSIYSGTDYLSRITGLVQLNSNDIRDLSTAVGPTVTDSLTDHETRITSNEAIVLDHETRIEDNEIDITTLEAIAIDHESRISTSEPTPITWEALLALPSRAKFQRYNVSGSADPTKDYGLIELASADYFTWYDATTKLTHGIDVT